MNTQFLKTNKNNKWVAKYASHFGFTLQKKPSEDLPAYKIFVEMTKKNPRWALYQIKEGPNGEFTKYFYFWNLDEVIQFLEQTKIKG